MRKPFIFDAHLDLSMNALEWNRDLRWTVERLRESEKSMTDRPDRGRGTVSFGTMRRGGVGMCVATLIARFVEPGGPVPGWHSQEQAWAQTQGQLAWYRAMEEAGEMAQVSTVPALERHLERWRSEEGPLPVGYVLALEGADSLVTLQHLERSYAEGLRAVGPAHYGPGVYAQGTNADGGIGEKGRALLREMEHLNIVLDATHLSDESFWECLDWFRGPVLASHNNCRVFVPHNRQFSDEQLQALIARGAVIGTALDAWMLVPGWEQGATALDRTRVSLSHVVDNIDHVCQLAGDSLHAAIGSDLDGAFGTEQCPVEVDTIADLQKIPPLLTARGYSSEDLANVCSGNLVRFFKTAWS